jgi:hypothetical protein
MLESRILAVGGLILAIYGGVFLVSPALLGDLVGLAFTGTNAPVEIRSFYGGLELGMAAFLFACSQRGSLVPAGLLFCALAFSCAGLARLAGVLQYGFEGPSQPFVGAIELAFAALCARLRARGAAR